MLPGVQSPENVQHSTSRNQSKSLKKPGQSVVQKARTSLMQWLVPRPPCAVGQKNRITEVFDVPEIPPPLPFINEVFSLQDTVPVAQLSETANEISFPVGHLDPWGDTLPTLDGPSMIRIIYQNVCHSVQPFNQDPSTAHIISGLQDLDCSIFCASETNVNWKNPAGSFAIRTTLQRSYAQVHMSTTCSTVGTFSEHRDRRRLPGGAGVFTFNQWAARVVASGEDSRGLGRWAFTTLRGRNNNQLANGDC